MVFNEGMVLPVHTNDLRLDATAHEVVLTFNLATGGGQSGQKQVVQEVAKLALSWPMFQEMTRMNIGLLGQAHAFRIASLRSLLEELESIGENGTEPG